MRAQVRGCLFGLAIAAGLIASCAPRTSQGQAPPLPCTPISPDDPIPTCAYRVVATFPHDQEAFTQGLAFVDGELYEGTGLRGQSTLRRVDLTTGRVLQMARLADGVFGEGIALAGERIVQLSLDSGFGLVYDRESFAELGRFEIDGQGWGIAYDGQRFIMSDGTAALRFLDPETFSVLEQVEVTVQGMPLSRVNELEVVRGEVYANIWQSDLVARISPQSGEVVAWIDLAGLLPRGERPEGDAVLNGIAYDAEGDRLFVTGKRWPTLFQIELVEGEDSGEAVRVPSAQADS